METPKKTAFYTYVKVEPVVRAFYVSVNQGEDLIIPSKHDGLWKLVKVNLSTVPPGTNPVPRDKDQYLRISLLCAHDFMREYRHYLDEEGQTAVAGYLRDTFRQVFHNYVFGAVSSGRCSQLDAIRGFFQDYGLSPDLLKMDTLIKSWNRSLLYQQWKRKKSTKNNRVAVL
jgi:hypothetical protein